MSQLPPVDFGIGQLVELIGDAVLVADFTSGRIVLWNLAAERLFDYSASEALGQPVELFLPDASRSQGWRRLSAPSATASSTGNGVGRAIELPAVRKGGEEVLVELTLTAIERPGGLRYALAILRDVSERDLQRRRLEALLRVARQLAADPEPARVFTVLLDEAVKVLGSDAATVYRWDEKLQVLVPVRNSLPTTDFTPFSPGQGAAGRAIVRRAPVIIDDYQTEPDMLPAVIKAGVRAGIAVPLLYEGKLLGAVGISSFSPDKRFTPEDAETLELLAGLGAAVLVGAEQSRLEGVLLAARTAEHELYNKLAVTKGYAQLLMLDQTLSPAQRRRAEQAVHGVQKAENIVNRLRQVTHLHETDWGRTLDTTIDLDRSTD